MKGVPFSIWMIVLLSFIMLISGCVGIGFGLGMGEDDKKSSTTYAVTAHEVGKIKKGNLVEIHKRGSGIIRGFFLGVEPYTYDPSDDLILLMLKREKTTLGIKSSEIAKIQVLAQKKNEKWIFAAIGAVIDVLLYSTWESWYPSDR